MTSYLQVVSANGRYFVRDGYHRSIGLIQRGVRYAPAFVKRDTAVQDLILPGMLPLEVFAGDRPPVMADYLDDTVCQSLQIPATHKVVLVQTIDVDVLG
jgi:hypothetical protein